MKVVIDIDSHSAIQDFSVEVPPPPYQFKSQDTVEWELYFTRDGVVQDMGSGFALKFGMIKTGDTTNTLLAYQTTFTYSTDSDGNIYYSGLVNFNTSQMASAITGLSSFNGTAEIRYQDTLNEIIHTINISTIVYATILVETGVTPPNVSTGYPDASTIELLVHKDAASGYAGLNGSSKLFGAQIPVDTQTVKINGSGQIASAAILAQTAANFTTPASGGTVSVTFVSTSGFIPGQYVRIPIAGYYIISSVTDGTHAVLTNNGDPFNAVSGTTITSGAVVLPAQAAAGGGGGQGAFTATTASFTVPAVGASITIAVGSTSWMGGNGYSIYVTGAGYYLVSGIVDSQHVTVTNSGSAANQLPGTVVSSGATVSAAGPQGPAGSAGVSLASYDTLAASFTMPNAGSNVNIQISNTAWAGVNQVIYITGGGYFQVVNIINATNLSITNLNYPGNAAAASMVASGARVGPGGLQGAQGAGGAGLNAFTTLSANFTQPAVNNTVTVNVGTTAWMAPGQGIYIQNGGYYSVQSIPDLTHAVVVNVGAVGNVPSGIVITGSGTQMVSPAGTPGLNGVNAYTNTTVAFTTPAAGASVTATVGVTSWASTGQVVFVAGAGYYQIAAILSSTQFSLTNLTGYGNAAGGTNIAIGASISPSGVIGPAGSAGSQGPAGRDGAFSTIYTGNSIQGTGGAASPATLVADVAQGTGAYKVYQRDSSGNSKWDVALLSAADAVNAPSAGEVSNIQSLANGVLAIKKLKAGTGVTLTDQGGSTGAILIAAGGGGGATNHTQAVRTSNWTYADATVIPWTGTTWDTDTKWASGNPSRLTIVTAGYYQVTVQLSWGGAGGGATNVIYVNVTVNGSTHPRLGGQVSLFGSLFTPSNQIISGVLKLNVGDYLEVIPWNQTGPAPTALVYEAASGSSPVGPLFQLDYMGT